MTGTRRDIAGQRKNVPCALSGTHSRDIRDPLPLGRGPVSRCPALVEVEAETLMGLAHRVAVLIPDHRDPDRYHESKSAIVSELRAMANGGR